MALKHLSEKDLTYEEAKDLSYDTIALLEIAHQLDRIADALEEQNKRLDNATEELTHITHELKH